MEEKTVILFFFLFFFILFLSFALCFLSYLLGKKSLKYYEFIRAFECGNELIFKGGISFSLRYFLVIIVFIIFDVEIALLLPIGFASSGVSWDHILLVSIFLVLVLLLGLFYEWNQGSLSWVY